METGKGFLYKEEAGCKFDEKTEKYVDSSINSAGVILQSMQLIGLREKDLPHVRCAEKCWKHAVDNSITGYLLQSHH